MNSSKGKQSNDFDQIQQPFFCFKNFNKLDSMNTSLASAPKSASCLMGACDHSFYVSISATLSSFAI